MLSAADIFWKTLPSMGAFFRIYEYLETLPIEFFWDDGIDSIYMHELLGRVKSMTKEDADYLLMSAKYLSGGDILQKTNLIFPKRPGKAQSASPWRNILPGLVFLCVFIKG